MSLCYNKSRRVLELRMHSSCQFRSSLPNELLNLNFQNLKKKKTFLDCRQKLPSNVPSYWVIFFSSCSKALSPAYALSAIIFPALNSKSTSLLTQCTLGIFIHSSGFNFYLIFMNSKSITPFQVSPMNTSFHIPDGIPFNSTTDRSTSSYSKWNL